MEAKSIHSGELGTECWLPIKFLGQCWRCDRYWRCTYATRVISAEFERLVAAEQRARKALENFKTRR